MRGYGLKEGAALGALATITGCQGGTALHSVMLLVTVSIFLGTILLDRS